MPEIKNNNLAMKYFPAYKLVSGLFIIFSLSGCVAGTIVDAAVDTTIAVAKVPFKVGGAVIDVIADE